MVSDNMVVERFVSYSGIQGTCVRLIIVKIWTDLMGVEYMLLVLMVIDYF